MDIDASKLKPVTTSDYQTLPSKTAPLPIPPPAPAWSSRWFSGSTDLRVRLTGEDGDGGVSGTRFSSDTQGIASAMRMSFTADGHTWVYNPNGGGG